ncbi:hypothetical protein [uncultured Ruminobacter sp.]|uniref:hypothetical protein n=1 Tax=uncultured Ruminobacter sp. TaxID=538947 RepID=UPI0025EE1D10|nr:hypothetical protein [uncultured Ruminobacter sp.]
MVFATTFISFVLMNCASADDTSPDAEAYADSAVVAEEHKNRDTSYNVIIKKIPNLKKNSKSREYQKREIVRLTNLSRDVCDTYGNSEPEKIICDNPKLMYLESEYLRYLGLKYDEHGCVFGCALHRGRLQTCAEHRFSSSCVENYFDVLIAEERIDQGMEEKQEMVLDCVPVVGESAFNDLAEEERHQLIILNMYSTQMPIGHFSIKGRNYRVYGFPQFKGQYLRDMNSLCYDCDYNNQLRFNDSGMVEIEIKHDGEKKFLNCEIH